MSEFDNMTQRDAVKTMGGLAVGAMLPGFVLTDFKARKPSIIFR